MYYRQAAAVLALGALIVPTPTFAMTGIGCPDLPAYARAVGTITMGEGACNMTTAEARRVIAAEKGETYVDPAAAPAPRHAARKHHHRRKTPQM